MSFRRDSPFPSNRNQKHNTIAKSKNWSFFQVLRLVFSPTVPVSLLRAAQCGSIPYHSAYTLTVSIVDRFIRNEHVST